MYQDISRMMPAKWSTIRTDARLILQKLSKNQDSETTVVLVNSTQIQNILPLVICGNNNLN